METPFDAAIVHVNDAVRAAVAAETPLVALESTVIAHGLPRPHNLETARACEAAVRGAGAFPATLSLRDGLVRVGCTAAELEALAHSEGIQKLSIRDLPTALARRVHGATTVATSVYIAARIAAPHRIHVFATGGIGGVHRGFAETLDISADLPVLASTDIVVVCAGAKAILELAATREWLETAGVTVVGYRTDTFAAFYSRSSGLPVDVRVEQASDVAALVRARRALRMRGATLVCVPVPADVEVPNALVEEATRDALAKAAAAGIRGKEVTPFLLRAVAEATHGQGLRANCALLVQNARIAGEIAKALAEPAA